MEEKEKDILDKFGNIVNLGDTIAFSRYGESGLIIGKIARFTPKTMIVDDSRGHNWTYRFPKGDDEFIKVPDTYLFMNL